MGLHSTNKVWKKDEITALIALYETERCLYDGEYEHFSDSIKRNEAFERIHDVMVRIRPNCTVGEIKYKINFLQRQYAGELLHRNISIKAGRCTDESYKSSMWCFELLQFLDDFLPTEKEEIVPTNSVALMEEQNEVPVEKPVSSSPKTNKKDHKDVAGSSSGIIENGAHDNHTERHHGKKRKSENSSSTKSVAEKTKVPVKSSFSREDIFGQYVASEMKNLKENPVLYLQTKQSILQILTSANFELINPE